MGKHALFAAMGLLVGLVAGFVIAGLLQEPARSPGPIADAPQNAPDRPLSTDEPLKGDPRPEPDSRPSPAPTGGSLSEIMAKAEIPPVPSGDGVITGHVRTADGTGVPGVKVTCSSDYPDDMGAALENAEERVAARIRYERWSDAAKHATLTDADGAYQLSGLHEATDYRMGAEAEGWALTQVARSKWRVRAGEVCDFTAEHSIKLHIRVLLPDGEPATSGNVDCKTDSGRRGMGAAITSKGCSVKLTPGVWSVSANSGKHLELKTEAVEVTIAAGTAPEVLELRLKSTPGVVGTVKPSSVDVGESAEVFLIGSPPSEPPGETFNEDESRQGQWRDEFSFLNIEPGPYRVLLVGSGYVLDWKDVMVADAVVEVTLQTPEPKRENFIIARAFGPDGKPTPVEYWNITYHSGNGSRGNGGGHTRQPDGCYWLSKRGVVSARKVVEDQSWFTVTATSDKYGSKEARYEVTDTHELEFRFVDPAFLTVTVTNLADHPSRDRLNWSLQKVAVAAELHHRSRFDESAVVTSPIKLGPVDPGQYDLVLAVATDSWESRELQRETITLVAGENARTATVPDLYTITVRFTSEQDSRSFSVRRVESSEGRSSSIRTDVEDGKAVITDLSAGTYDLESRSGVMRVTVPGQAEITFAAKPFDCYLLTVPVGGDIEALGVLNGDKLVALDDEPLEVNELGNALVQASLTKESTKWTVIRNGVQTDVTFNGKTLFEIMNRKGERRERLRINPGFKN